MNRDALLWTGAYAARFPAWLDFLIAHFDYFWFAAAIVWSLVLVLYWQHPRRAALTAWRWLPWSAASALLTAAIVIGNQITPAVFRFESHRAPIKGYYITGVVGDLALGAVVLAAGAGWWWSAVDRTSARARRLCYLLWGLLALLAALRWSSALLPFAAGVIAATALAASAPWWSAPRANAWSRAALGAAALIPFCSVIGPLPFLLGAYQRAGSPYSGLVEGAWQLPAALLAAAGLVRQLPGSDRAARRRFWREARPFALAAGACFLGGFAAAALNGTQQLSNQRNALLTRARLMAETLDPALIARALGPELRPPASFVMRPWGPVAHSAALAAPAYDPLRRELSRLARGASDTVRSVALVALRDDRLLVAFTSLSEEKGEVMLARSASVEDRAHWAGKSAWIEGPLSLAQRTGTVHLARTPLLDRGGVMLGWLELTSFFTANYTSRATPFAGATLGIVVLALFFVQGRQSRAREAARHEAALAAESERVKTSLLASVSHELRTPLQNIRAYGELLERHVDDGGRAHLATLRRESESMLDLVNALLDRSALELGAFRLAARPVALGELVRQTCASLAPAAAAKKLRLDVAIDPRLPLWLATDPERWRQIVRNLAGNAVKFTAHGAVSVALELVAREPDRVVVELAVRDTGPGIAPAEQARLFRPFSRLDAAAPQEGTGLGLALAAAICRSAGGDLTVESDGVHGACFRVRLPLPLAAPPAAASAAPAAPRSLHGRRILVADDNAPIRESFLAILAAHGADADAASDGAEALRLARTGHYDALVLDLAMPGLPGDEVAHRLRRGGALSLFIVGVSAHASEADRARATAAGMNAFLAKPLPRLDDLVRALDGVPQRLSAELEARLHARMLERVRADTPGKIAEAAAALARRDWPALRQCAHYLKNTACALHSPALFEHCTALEDAAVAGDAAAAASHWEDCLAFLRPWIEPGSD